MDINKIIANPKDNEFNVIIEISMNAPHVKYEIDKASGAIFVDRFMDVTMFYPCNYGFIPHTLSEDGDPIDVLVISKHPVISGSVIRARPVGVLVMEDESGMDEKIIAVPVSKLDKSFDKVQDIKDVDETLLSKITHFFNHYKDLEKGKWVKINGFEGFDKASVIISESIMRNQKDNIKK